MRSSFGFAPFVLLLLPVAACGGSVATPPETEPEPPGEGGGNSAGTTSTDATTTTTSTGPGTNPYAELDPVARCEAIARAGCERFDACAPFFSEAIYGGVEGCVVAADCVATVAGGAELDPDRIATCVANLESATCDDYWSAPLDLLCYGPGPRAKGETCGRATDCASLSCAFDGSNACGRCVERGVEGGACDPGGACAAGTTCLIDPQSGEATCGVPAREGEACDGTWQCVYGKVCRDGSCRPAPTLGERCTSDEPCSFAVGLACVNGVCEAATVVPTGAACGGEDVFTCAGGGACEGTCLPPAGEGEACGSGACALPLACVNGVCRSRDACG